MKKKDMIYNSGCITNLNMILKSDMRSNFLRVFRDSIPIWAKTESFGASMSPRLTNNMNIFLSILVSDLC